VAGVGDMDGDGYGEVAVGSYSFGSTGKVYVYRGSSSGSDAAASWSQAGAQVNGAFGSTVAAAGDVNGDGKSDLLVGAVFQDGAGGTDCGRGYVLTGPFPLTTFADFAGPSNFANMGHAFAAGDVNGDGFGDLVFGEPRLFQTQFDEGGFQLYLGNRGAGRSRPANLTRPSYGGIPVALYGTSASNTEVGISGVTFSTGGRDRAALEWLFQPLLAGAAMARTITPYVLMGPPTETFAGALSILWLGSGMTSGMPYSWSVRNRAKSPYFRFGPWISPQPNARGQWDFRTAPRTTAVAMGSGIENQALKASPNPAAPMTRLSFVLPRSAEVSLMIRDVSGRVVRRLESGWRQAGPHEVQWDGRDDVGRSCAAGLYFASMRAGADRQTLRVTLLR